MTSRASGLGTRDSGLASHVRVPNSHSRGPLLFLGIDPGTAVTGYGLVRDDGSGGGPSLVECGVVRTSPRTPLATRLREVHDGIADVIARHHPDVMAVEDVFYSRNVRTTITLGHARGVVLLAGERAGIPIHEFPPAEVKKAVTGTGAATKEQVQFMLTRLLRLKCAPQPADAADGVAVALACLQSRHLWNGPKNPEAGTKTGARRSTDAGTTDGERGRTGARRGIDAGTTDRERGRTGARRSTDASTTDGERGRTGARRGTDAGATDGERGRTGARRGTAGAIK